jgi:hypothetical protein
MPEQAVKTVLKEAVLVAHCDHDERLFSARDCGIDERGANAQRRCNEAMAISTVVALLIHVGWQERREVRLYGMRVKIVEKLDS